MEMGSNLGFEAAKAGSWWLTVLPLEVCSSME